MNRSHTRCHARSGLSLKTVLASCLLVLMLLCAPGGFSFAAQEPASNGPLDKASMSTNRLARLDDYLNGRIESGFLTGAVVAIARRGERLPPRAYGHLDAAASLAMPVDAVFDLGRLTEPVMATAALIMQEQGSWLLADRIGRYLPEFTDYDLTVWDALRHASGLEPSIPPLRFVPGQVVRHSDRLTRPVQAATSFTGQSFIRRLADQPLRYQPGQVAERAFDYDLAGLALEKAANQTLGTFFLRNLFIPLDMWDTGFNPPAGMENRLVARSNSPGSRDPREPVIFECGGACLTGTAGDYLSFAMMLLDEGRIASGRVLGRFSVKQIVRRQLGAETENRLASLDGDAVTSSFDFGLGVSIAPGQVTPLPVQAGDFGVASPGGQLLWVSPGEQLVIVMLARLSDNAVQRDQQRLRLQQQVIALVRQAITD